METRARHVIVGAFVVISVLAALLFTLWLWSPTAERDYNYYIIGFARPVSGLTEGARVEYSGVRVGEVVDLSLDTEDPRRVRALIRVEKETPVKVDTKADLALANISGAMKVQLFGGDPDSPALEGEPGRPAFIAAEPSSIAAVLESGEGLITGLNDVLLRLERLLSEDNIESFTRSLQHLEQLSDEGRLALNEISQLARSTNRALNQEGSGLLPVAGQAMQSLQRSSQRIEDLLERNQDALDGGLASLDELQPALQELRNTLAGLAAITRRLEENPRGFLFEGEGLQEFEP